MLFSETVRKIKQKFSNFLTTLSIFFVLMSKRPDVKGRKKRITGKLKIKKCLNCQLLTQREEKLNSLQTEKQTHCFVLTVILIIKFDKRAKR